MDKIIFPNGKSDIVSIDFPDGSKLTFSDWLECQGCKDKFLAQKTFDQHITWEKQSPGITFNPASLSDFLHRQCPSCNEVNRINKFVKANTRGGNMPNAADVMEIKMTGDEVKELSKDGDVIGTFVGCGEIVEFDDKQKKNPDGSPVKIRKIKVTVDLNGEERTWMPNYTTMKSLISKYGQNTDDWDGKKVKLKARDQIIAGSDKVVIYGEPAE